MANNAFTRLVIEGKLVAKYTVNCCEEYSIMSIDELINNTIR